MPTLGKGGNTFCTFSICPRQRVGIFYWKSGILLKMVVFTRKRWISGVPFSIPPVVLWPSAQSPWLPYIYTPKMTVFDTLFDVFFDPFHENPGFWPFSGILLLFRVIGSEGASNHGDTDVSQHPKMGKNHEIPMSKMWYPEVVKSREKVVIPRFRPGFRQRGNEKSSGF